jgi:hypothetical protein
VVVFNGRVVLRSGATVTGDVVSQSDPVVAPGAIIGGATRRVQTNVNWKGSAGWTAGLVAGRVGVDPGDRVGAGVAARAGAAWILKVGRTQVGPAIGCMRKPVARPTTAG